MGGSIGQIVAGGAANGMAGVQSSIANSPFARAMEAMTAAGQTPTAGAATADATSPIVPGADPITPSTDTVPAGTFDPVGGTATQLPGDRRIARRNAIASIESAGSGDYGAVGPTHTSLGRALGRYQIMEANIGPWSQEALGRRVTADEFMRNPKIQDDIFDYKFGKYADKYGESNAAQAWFAGEGGIGTGRKDVLGTSTGEYARKFDAAMGRPGIADQQVAAAPSYKDTFNTRMFGGGGSAGGSTGEAIKPGQGEQLQKQLQQRGRRAVTPRGGSGVRMANADSSGGGGVDDSRRRQLLARAKELVPQGRSDRATSRKQAIRARVRGQA